MNYDGERRILGVSGSGKTIILIHRALRLAMENPENVVRIFTINRSLAEHLEATIQAIHGNKPNKLHVHAFYDFLILCLGTLGESPEKYRLVDDRSNERICHSWKDFFNHPKNIFAKLETKLLVSYIAR